jgi:ankyrin repeat protein
LSSQSTGSSVRDDEEVWNSIYKELQNLNASESSIEAVRVLVLQRSTLPEPRLDTLSSLASPVRLTNSRQDEILPLIDNESTLSKSTYHSLSAILKARLKRPRSSFTTAAKGGDIVTLSSIINDRAQRSLLDQKSINNALIAVASNGKREREQIQVIGLLLNQKAELEYKDDEYGRTPLIWAVTVGREDIVDSLLDNQALIEMRDDFADRTPLMWAVWWGNEVIVKRLIDRGACLNAVDSIWERTPLLWAAKRGTYGAAAILLQRDRSENIEVKDKEQLTPLALAYVEGHEPVANILLNHGANPNCTLPSGMPLLISAATLGDETFAHLLINHGANIQCKNKEGIPALSVAVREEHPSISELLIAKGASLEVKDGQGRTALAWAVGRDREDLVELLLRSGADKFAVDNEGRTVREWAELTGDERIIALLSSGEG